MVVLKFESCKIFLFVLILCTFINSLETKAVYIKKHSTRIVKDAKLLPGVAVNIKKHSTRIVKDAKLLPGVAKISDKLISDLKDKDPTSQGRVLFGDMMCALCRKINNITCILRYCTGANTENNKVPVDEIDKIKIDIEKPTVIDMFGDLMCQMCIEAKNETCKARYCSKKSQPKAPLLQTPVKPVLRLQGRKVHSLSPNRRIYKRSLKDFKSIFDDIDKDETKVAILGDALCALCIETGNLTCIQRYCNQANKQDPSSIKQYSNIAIA